MDYHAFEKPVPVIVGIGFVKQIRSVMDAYTFLNEWSPSHHKAAHTVALKLCKAAISGQVDAETVRRVFVECAACNHLLAPSVEEAGVFKPEGEVMVAVHSEAA
jgi:hypothetical protein